MTREGAGGKRDLDGVGQRGVKQVSECGRCLWGGPNGIQPPNGTSQGRGRGGSEVGGLAGGGQAGLVTIVSSLHTFPLAIPQQRLSYNVLLPISEVLKAQGEPATSPHPQMTSPVLLPGVQKQAPSGKPQTHRRWVYQCLDQTWECWRF